MSDNNDILAAMKAEKEKQKAFSVQHPQLGPQLTAADIVKSHQEQVNVGKGAQKIGADANLGAPSTGQTIENSLGDVKNFFKIPGLKEALKNDRR